MLPGGRSIRFRMPIPRNFERKLFDLIEVTSRAQRTGEFASGLAQALLKDLGGPLELRATGVFQPENGRYELRMTAGEPLWSQIEPMLTARTWQRRLEGNLWWVQRGLKYESPAGTEWLDLILIPVGARLQRVMGLLTRSLAGDDGQEREAAFQVLGRLVRLFVDRHHQKERLREILTLAREQQMSLLQTALPPVAGYEVAGLSIPDEEVGGDYFQITPLNKHLFGMAIADAKGKGFEAAVLTTGLHTALRVANQSPFKVTHKVELLNRSLVAPGEIRNLVSMFYGELDASGRIIYVNCSHPAPILVRANSLEELSAGGLFLGLGADTEYELGVCELSAGDLIVAYTDGWSELFNEAGEEFGVERLRDTVRGLHGAAPQDVITAVQAACDQFRGPAPYHDDRTLVVVRKE